MLKSGLHAICRGAVTTAMAYPSPCADDPPLPPAHLRTYASPAASGDFGGSIADDASAAGQYTHELARYIGELGTTPRNGFRTY